MEPTTVNPAQATQMAAAQAMIGLQNRIKGGISWFYWIAGLSIINSLIYLTGATTTFIVGLAVTQIVDGLASGFARELPQMAVALKVVGMVINLVIAGVFVACGVFGMKRIRWVVIVGMVLYALDMVIFLLFRDWLPAFFHAFALFGLWRGLQAIGEIKKFEESLSVGDMQTVQTLVASLPKTTNEFKPNRSRMGVIIALIAVLALIVIGILVVAALGK